MSTKRKQYDDDPVIVASRPTKQRHTKQAAVKRHAEREYNAASFYHPGLPLELKVSFKEALAIRTSASASAPSIGHLQAQTAARINNSIETLMSDERLSAYERIRDTYNDARASLGASIRYQLEAEMRSVVEEAHATKNGILDGTIPFPPYFTLIFEGGKDGFEAHPVHHVYIYRTRRVFYDPTPAQLQGAAAEMAKHPKNVPFPTGAHKLMVQVSYQTFSQAQQADYRCHNATLLMGSDLEISMWRYRFGLRIQVLGRVAALQVCDHAPAGFGIWNQYTCSSLLEKNFAPPPFCFEDMQMIRQTVWYLYTYTHVGIRQPTPPSLFLLPKFLQMTAEQVQVLSMAQPQPRWNKSLVLPLDMVEEVLSYICTLDTLHFLKYVALHDKRFRT